MQTQFSLARKVGIGIGVVLFFFLVLSLGLLYKTQKSSLDALIHDKAERVLLALQASHTQAMLHRGHTLDNNPVLNAFNSSLETLQKTEKDMRIWLFMSQKLLDYQKSQKSHEIETPKDDHDLKTVASHKIIGRFETDTLYRLSFPIILGEGVAANPKCFSCHEDEMGIHKGELIGGLSVAYDASKDIAEFNSAYTQAAIVVVLLISTLSVIVFFLINRFVSKPIRSISNQMKRLSAADKSVVIPEVNRAASLEEAQILESMHKIFDVSKSNIFNFRNALDEHNIVSIADLDGNIVVANNLFCKISGYSQQELLGKNHRILNSGEHSTEFFDAMWHCISNGEIWKGEIKNRAKDGSFYWVSSTIMPFFDESGNIFEYVSVRTDITHLKDNEAKLLQMSQQAQAANEAKSQFLATMSHEIRTPMNGVLGMAQLLEGTDLDSEQKEYLATITSSGESLLKIINDILDFSKLGANKVELENIPFDLERVCQESLSLVSGNIQGKTVELILDYQPECPRFFMGDPARMKQILLNLLSNAIKFTKEGFVSCRVNCQQIEQKYFIEIQIEDTGIGLKQESINHLFEEFTQADNSTTRQYGGTGLGLSICKKLLDIMDGNIHVESTFGGGSTFTISVNLEKAEEPAKIESTSLDGVRVLFVDDNAENRRVFKRQLEHMGMRIDLLDNSLQAIELLHAEMESDNPYKIAIIDHNMPLINGLELGRLIQKDSSLESLKTMIFSSAGAKGDAAVFAKSGFDAYLNKLSRYEVLQSILSAMLTHKKGDPIITQHSISDAQQFEQNKQLNFEAKILLVEDVLANQVIAQKMLMSMGLTVDTVSDGEQAIEAFQNQDYSLIFMDCRMPVMDGYESTRAIRTIEQVSERQRTPIIALTANIGAEDKSQCVDAGMDDLLSKPFNKTDLSQCLEYYLTTNKHKHEDTKMSDEVIFDEAIFNTLKEDMGEDIDEVIAVSLESIESNIKGLISKTREDDLQEVIRLAHSIKSPAGFIGAKHLTQLSASLEDGLRHNQDIDVQANVDEIQQVFNLFRKVIEALK